MTDVNNQINRQAEHINELQYAIEAAGITSALRDDEHDQSVRARATGSSVDMVTIFHQVHDAFAHLRDINAIHNLSDGELASLNPIGSDEERLGTNISLTPDERLEFVQTLTRHGVALHNSQDMQSDNYLARVAALALHRASDIEKGIAAH